MGSSASDSRSRVPGFRDGLGERHTVAQRSGGELEYLQFRQPLAAEPFFAEALKSRVVRLSTFSHASYCRVRRVQHAAGGDGSIALVSTHVAGRRLAELLDVAARADLKPTTGAVLAVTRQIMATAALLHDFAPDGFHGALGLERVILAGDGRVVLAEHVLGTVVERAAEAWGPERLWREFRLATLPGTGLAHDARRADVLQIGVIALSLCLGRPLDDEDFPNQIGWLLARATERQAGRAETPLRPALRTWFERSLSVQNDVADPTLLDSQKALGQLAPEPEFAGSSAEWDAFVHLCETAAVRVPLVVRVPETAETVSSARTVSAIGDGASATGASEPLALQADPFGPWPVAVPADSAATLFDTFLARRPSEARADHATPIFDVTAPPLAGLPATPADPTVAVKPSPIDPDSVTFEADPTGRSGTRTRPIAIDQRSIGDVTPVIQQTAEPALTVQIDTQPGSRVPVEARPPLRRPPTSSLWARLVVTGVLAVLATTGAVYSPQLWVLAYERLRIHGRVRVESNPPDALITVDGELRGRTPAVLRLRPGEYQVEVQIGGSARSKKITVQAEADMTETFMLPEAGQRGGFHITTHPSPGRISIDGKYRGDAPLTITDLVPGLHTLAVETTLGMQEQDVFVQSGSVRALAVPTASWVKVNAPFDLEVLEDARLLGSTNSGPVLVRPGRHNLEFANKELGLKLRQFIDVAPGQVLTVPLEIPTGMMNVYADLAADVFVDGKKVGETPLSSLQLPLGPHDVVLNHPIYGDVRYSVRVTLAAPVHLRVTFRK
jgi:hypothetical protein